MLNTERDRADTCTMPSSPAVFLRSACASLLIAMARADEPNVVDEALAEHAAAHTTWLRLIAAARGERLREVLDALYHLHGRVAGRLEHDCPFPLPAHIEQSVRAMLAAELADLTDSAIAALAEEARVPASV